MTPGYMKLIDTNIFIYSVGEDHDFRAPSLGVLRRIRSGQIEATVSTEVLQEILHYYRSGRRVHVGIGLFDELISQFPQPLPILAGTARTARDILHRYPSLQSRDAFHAAVVFENGLEGIISADRGLDVIEGLVRFDPKELAA